MRSPGTASNGVAANADAGTSESTQRLIRSTSRASSSAVCAASISSSGIPVLCFGADFRNTQTRFAPSPPSHLERDSWGYRGASGCNL